MKRMLGRSAAWSGWEMAIVKNAMKAIREWTLELNIMGVSPESKCGR